MIASSLIPSALYKHSVATAAIKGKFLGILDAVPLLLVTLEKSGHCWAVIAPGVQEECQQLLCIILPPLPAATELCLHSGQAQGLSYGLAWPGNGHPGVSVSLCHMGASTEPGAAASR